MTVTYLEGKSLASNLLADLNTAILGNADWTRPNAAAHASLYKCTTTRGADMVIDLADAAITAQRLQVSAYTSYDGTTLGTKIPNSRYLLFKINGTGATNTNYVYWWLSISKDHFFLMVEGPRPQDANPDRGDVGSVRSYMFAGDLVPYFAPQVDPNPAVVYGMSSSAGVDSQGGYSHKGWVSKTVGGLNWNMGSLLTLEFPQGNNASCFTPVANRMGLDGNLFLSPYVYFDDTDGIRGRLNNFFYAGASSNYGDPDPAVTTIPAPNTFTTYGGQKYKLLATQYDGYYNNNGIRFGPFGNMLGLNNVQGLATAPLVAVPCV